MFGVRQLLIGVLAVVCAANVASAGSHLWRFNEVFTNADGTIQFVELKESMGAPSETFLLSKWVRSESTGKELVFPENLIGPTSNKHLLLATAGFAALPGAPTPDYILPDGFFAPDTDFLTYWTYSEAIMYWTAGQLPTDGVNSLNIDGTTGPNSPTNYAGVTGSVAVGVPVPAASSWGLVVLAVAILSLATTVLQRRFCQSRSVA